MTEPPNTQPLWELNIRKPYLQLIADGVKTIEVRVGHPGIRELEIGQDLTFVAGDQRVLTRVKRVAVYESFNAMLDHEDPRAIGGDLGKSKSQILAVIRSIYPSDQERLGAVAIEIERI